MWIPWNDMPDHSRIWVYPSTTSLQAIEQELLEQYLIPFCDNWQVHGKPLQTSAHIVDHHLVVLAVNEDHAAASGCSIDSSVAVIKQIESHYQLDLMNRMYLHYLNTQGEICGLSSSGLKSAIKSGIIRPDTIVYQTNLAIKTDLNSALKIPASESWVRRFFKDASIPS